MSTSVEISTAAPASAAELAPVSLPNGGQGATPSAVHGLDLWLENFRKYETTLVRDLYFYIRDPANPTSVARGY